MTALLVFYVVMGLPIALYMARFKRCTYCRSKILKRAIVCSHCTRGLADQKVVKVHAVWWFVVGLLVLFLMVFLSDLDKLVEISRRMESQ